MPISCSACAAENADESRFCNQCGAGLPRGCPACGVDNPAEARFCGGCGAGLGENAASPAPAAAPVAERREVTVLFADLSGFTKMSTSQDPEETHAVLNRYFAIADGAVERYGGSIDKHIGDNVMGVFGASLAHSNDPERAVRAAIDIHRELAELDIGISAHIGIASGTVLASGTGSDTYSEYTVTGETVNLASRLQDIAKSGEIVISDKVRAAVEGIVETSASGDVEIKGFDRAVTVWAVQGLRDSGSTETAVPLIGRKMELAQCAAVLDAMTSDAPNQIILLRGEPGIGKSRLLSAIGSQAREAGYRTHNFSFRDFGGGDDDILCGIARSAAYPDKDPGEPDIDALAGSLTIEPGLIPCLFDLMRLPIPPVYAALVSAMDPAAMRSGRLDCLDRILKAAGDGRPQMVSVEDVHWAGETALADLAAAIRIPGLSGVVFVLTSRMDNDPLKGAWRAALSGIPLFAIDMPPVSRADAVALAAQLAGSEIENIEFLIDRAEGNPLFLEQLIRSTADAGAGSLPGSIQSVVLARLDALDRHNKEAIQAASVFGTHFSADGLRHLIGDPKFDCRALTDAFLLRPEGAEYAFAHALIRDGAYESLPHSRKRVLHLSAAAWYCELDPVLYAEHLDRADDEKAATAYAFAARSQIAALRLDSARVLAERGSVVADTNEVRFQLLALVGEIRRRVGDPLASIAAYQDANAIAGNDRETAISQIGIAAGARMTGATEDGLQALSTAEPAALRLDNPEILLAQIGYYRGGLLFGRGDREGCIVAHEMAYRNAVAADDPVWTAHALSGLGDAHYAAGRMAQALENFHKCIELCDRHDIGDIAVSNRFIQGNCRRYLNEFEAGYEDATRSLEGARIVRNSRVQMVSAMICGEFEIDRGETDRAFNSLQESLSVCENLGNRRFRAYTLTHVARAHHVTGNTPDATAAAREAMTISRETDPTFVGPRAAAILALTLGDADEARDALSEGENILEKGCIAHNYLWFWRDALEWAIETGNSALTRTYATRLETCIDGEPLPWARLLADRGRALADHADGRTDPGIVLQLRDALTAIRMNQAAIRLTASLP